MGTRTNNVQLRCHHIVHAFVNVVNGADYKLTFAYYQKDFKAMSPYITVGGIELSNISMQ